MRQQSLWGTIKCISIASPELSIIACCTKVLIIIPFHMRQCDHCVSLIPYTYSSSDLLCTCNYILQHNLWKSAFYFKCLYNVGARVSSVQCMHAPWCMRSIVHACAYAVYSCACMYIVHVVQCLPVWAQSGGLSSPYARI
jgi:hypothetical protein